MPRLLLEPDWGADPLWDYDTGTMVRLDSLPVSEPTRVAVLNWRDGWEELASRQSRADDIAAGLADGAHEPPTDAEWAMNETEMQRVWSLLREDLGGDWEIAIARDREGRRYVKWEPGAQYREVHEPAGRRFWTEEDPDR